MPFINGPNAAVASWKTYELVASGFGEQQVWMMAALFLAPEDLRRRVVSVARLEGQPLDVEIGPPEPPQKGCFASRDFCHCTI